ncbi:GumC family protein [Phenylobacterium sp.]|uniref:GumC family protein n=1 Tax=Phenylobacterium sp. TaxID=1871053 RepID=UPI002ED83A3B
MSIIQFLRIIWAYRFLIVASTVICTLIAAVTVQLVRPRYEAQSRVMLDVIKPDPVTGQVMATAFLRAYTKTQIELVKDLQVARRVVEDLGWENDPRFQAAYRNRDSAQMDLDFTRWAAEEVMGGANAKLIEGSNILEISFGSPSPERAKQVADALRKAYIEMTLQSRREAARRNADWYEAQAEKSKAILFKAETDKATFERENGILLQDDKIDIDSARLAALASQGQAPVFSGPAAPAPSAGQLALADAELAQASRVLGPNHPTLKALQARKALLEQQVAQERNTAASAANAAVSAARATSGMLEAQKAKVMAQRDKVERLRLMQDEIDLRREQYTKGIARAAQLRQEAEVAEAGVVPLANAITPQEPEFPKKRLIIAASFFGGMGLGLVIGLMLELFGRRIRSADDLEGAVDAPVLAVVRRHGRPAKTSWWRPDFGRRIKPFRPRSAASA